MDNIHSYHNLRRVFWCINHFFMVPVFRLGLGAFIVNPFSGYIMVVKTVGKKTGKTRYAPVNYAILDGQVYCLTGQVSHWYHNLRANPKVELLMPGRTLAGVAEEVTDPEERLCAARQILKNGGFAGFFMGFNPFTAPDDTVQQALQGSPVIRIRPTGIGSGPADPGGWLWLLGTVATLGLMWFGRRGKKR